MEELVAGLVEILGQILFDVAGPAVWDWLGRPAGSVGEQLLAQALGWGLLGGVFGGLAAWLRPTATLGLGPVATGLVVAAPAFVGLLAVAAGGAEPGPTGWRSLAGTAWGLTVAVAAATAVRAFLL